MHTVVFGHNQVICNEMKEFGAITSCIYALYANQFMQTGCKVDQTPINYFSLMETKKVSRRKLNF